MSSANVSYEDAIHMEEGKRPGPPSPQNTLVEKQGNAGTVAAHGDENTKPSMTVFQHVKAWASVLAPKLSPGKAEFTVNCLDDYPEGYPRLSCFLNSDDSFMMYRGFSQLHSRLLLTKQDELQAMEQELFNLDKKDKLNGDELYLRCRVDDERRPPPQRARRSRTVLLKAIEAKLEEYTKCLRQAHFVQTMDKPTDRDHAKVSTYFRNNEPLVAADREFIFQKEDLITIRAGREHAWLDSFIESVLRWYPCRPIKYIFCSKETRAKTTDPNIRYFSRNRINICVTMIITCVIALMLVVPTVMLLYLTMQVDTPLADGLCVAVVLICTMFFSMALNLLTKAKRHEVLAAAVA